MLPAEAGLSWATPPACDGNRSASHASPCHTDRWRPEGLGMVCCDQHPAALLAATSGSASLHKSWTGCRSSKTEVAGRDEHPRDGGGQHAREAQPDRQRSRESQPDQAHTPEGSPARERAADRAGKRESASMTEAAHPAVGEKRQVGGGALALDCSGFNCLSLSSQLLGACGGIWANQSSSWAGSLF